MSKCTCPWGPGEGIKSPGTRETGGVIYPAGWRELNPCSLEKRHVLSHLSSPGVLFICILYFAEAHIFKVKPALWQSGVCSAMAPQSPSSTPSSPPLRVPVSSPLTPSSWSCKSSFFTPSLVSCLEWAPQIHCLDPAALLISLSPEGWVQLLTAHF